MNYKTITITSIIFLLVFFIFSNQAGNTISYFYDSETSLENSMSAALLDFTVSGPVDVPVGIEATTTPPTVVPIILPEQGSLPIEYKIRTLQTSGDTNFCNQLYTPFGPLLALVTASSTSMDSWSLEFSLASTSTGIRYGDMCTVDLIYFGWHDGDEGLGYNDEEKISLVLHSISTSTDLIFRIPALPLIELDLLKIDIEKATTTEEILATTTPPEVSEEQTTPLMETPEEESQDQAKEEVIPLVEELADPPQEVSEEIAIPVEEVTVVEPEPELEPVVAE